MLVVKKPPANAGDIKDMSLIPGLGRSSGGGHGNPLQYSCLENSQGQRNLVGCNPQSKVLATPIKFPSLPNSAKGDCALVFPTQKIPGPWM